MQKLYLLLLIIPLIILLYPHITVNDSGYYRDGWLANERGCQIGYNLVDMCLHHPLLHTRTITLALGIFEIPLFVNTYVGESTAPATTIVLDECPYTTEEAKKFFCMLHDRDYNYPGNLNSGEYCTKFEGPCYIVSILDIPNMPYEFIRDPDCYDFSCTVSTIDELGNSR